MIVKLILFSVAWLVIIYVANCLLARKRISLRSRALLVSVGTMTILGVFGELLIDMAYRAVFEHQLWQYRFTPLHGGDTSVYSIVLWASLGVHMYLLQSALERWRIKSIHLWALIFCFEAIIIEACVNLTFILVFGWHMYYFYPGDLWHITSLQTLPIYLAAGYTVFGVLKLAKRTQVLE